MHGITHPHILFMDSLDYVFYPYSKYDIKLNGCLTHLFVVKD